MCCTHRKVGTKPGVDMTAQTTFLCKKKTLHCYQTLKIPVVLLLLRSQKFSVLETTLSPCLKPHFSDFSAMSQDGGVGDPIPSSFIYLLRWFLQGLVLVAVRTLSILHDEASGASGVLYPGQQAVGLTPRHSADCSGHQCPHPLLVRHSS
jgi:hypothetical protein